MIKQRLRTTNKRGAIVIGVFVTSVLGFVVAFLVGGRSVGTAVGAPAIILSGLAALGHLVTFDDDMPGGWSLRVVPIQRGRGGFGSNRCGSLR
jgi:hypothetical protein